MPDISEAKRMARALREAMTARSVSLTHSQSLEVIAQTLGHADWNTLSAKAGEAPQPTAGEAVRFEAALPILRMFDVARTKAFYVDLLGFSVDFEHRYEENFPLFMQVSRAGLRLHLSEHHGDGTPGSAVYIYMKGIDAFHAEISARGGHAGIEPGPAPNMRVLQLWDPSSNQLRFAERSL